jgi:ribulose-bisphosphate carboxylase large chain
LGTAAGVAAMQEAWEAALAGVSLAEFARDRPNLQRALEMVV